MARGKRKGATQRARVLVQKGGPKLLQQTEGITPGLQRRIVPVRGAIVPRRELKYLDVASAAYGADTTGSVTLLNGIAEGDDNIGRTGRQVMMRSVGLTGYVKYGTATSTPAQRCRLMLVWDNATNGVAPAVADVLAVANAISFHNVDNESRFTVLWDHTLVIGPFSNTATQSYADSLVRDVNVVIPLASVTQYIGTSAAIGSVGNGGLFLITTGTTAAGTSAAIATLATRVRYADQE